MTWQLRHADAGDLEAIMQLETSIFANDAWSRAIMREELSNPNAWYLVAFRPETPGGIDAYAGVLAPRGAKEADIQTIAVAEAARRGGLGRTVMLTLINEAVKRGADEVFLEVRADNPGARALYQSLGFEELAVRARYYQPDGVDAIVMRLAPVPRGATLAAPEVGSPHPEQPEPGDGNRGGERS
ncbi:ribosomal-protein-alanine acetyltransferase [Cryobacterium mesophilum]|nr:ribosomal protein S18-alanine N-acetyltransferase [Terrimesophilobacter mesophilus]MBB5632887.1 ribosomal-protein-alanine acetyltransferase [Terrimesophilobacter mesophilus]